MDIHVLSDMFDIMSVFAEFCMLFMSLLPFQNIVHTVFKIKKQLFGVIVKVVAEKAGECEF